MSDSKPDSFEAGSTSLQPGLATAKSLQSSASLHSLASSSTTVSSLMSSKSESKRLRKKRVTIMEDGKFSVEYPDEDPKSDEGIPRRHPLVQDCNLITTYSPKVSTLYDSFQSSVVANWNRPYLGTREKLPNGAFGGYIWETYNDVNDKVKALSAALNEMNLSPNTCVGLYSINRAEWLIAEQACFSLSLVTVPLYDTLGDDIIEYICNHVEMSVLFCSSEKLEKIFSIHQDVPTLKTIISFDKITEKQNESAQKFSVTLDDFPTLLETGKTVKFIPRPPLPSDLCTICYTSGTTGLPKGVMLPHSALLADAAACLALCGYGTQGFDHKNRSLFELKADDCHISYLPLAHIFERIVITALTTVGASIGFYQGDTLKLMDDISILKPTVFVSVPRLFNRIYDKVKSTVKSQGGFKAFLFNTAYESKLTNLTQNGQLTHWLWDSLVFSGIREKLGGRVRAMLCGSAPISPEVMDFLRVCFSCEVYEGYGQTETSAGTCLTVRHDWTTGHVGIPAPCNEVKLVDVPEMGYSSQDKPFPRGEICVRGPNCFVGYFKDEERTRETIDANGWIHSGDIGEWDERGRLRVIDRKKNLFKLAQGEYVAPEKIENTLTKIPLVAQAFVHGDSLESSTVAIIVPDREILEKWQAKQTEDEKVLNSEYKELCKMDRVKELLMKEILSFGRKGTNELKGFEIPKEIYVEDAMFSIENGLLTATFKLKRNEALKYYKTKIEEMYKNMKNGNN